MSEFVSFPKEGLSEAPDATSLSGLYSRMKSVASNVVQNVLATNPAEGSPEQAHFASPPSFASPPVTPRVRPVAIPGHSALPASSPIDVHKHTPGTGASGPLRYLQDPLVQLDPLSLDHGGQTASPVVTLSPQTSSYMSDHVNLSTSSLDVNHLPGYAVNDGSSDSEGSTIAELPHHLSADKIKSGGIGKEYWMKDESVSECFLCSRHFNAWRRRHHCRICGRIFCSACTRLIDGARFHYHSNRKMRVCANCLDVATSTIHTRSQSPTPSHDAASIHSTPITESPGGKHPRMRGIASAGIFGGSSQDLSMLSSSSKLPYEDAISSEEEDEYSSPRNWRPRSSTIPKPVGASSMRIRARSLGPKIPKFNLNRARSTLETRSSGRYVLSDDESKTGNESSLGPFLSPKRMAPTPTIESQIDLTAGNIEHSKAFLGQLLDDYGIPVSNLEPLMKPLLFAANNLDLDIRGGDFIDIRHYVKLKLIPGGSITDSFYMDGIIFSGNVALKSMPTQIVDARILLLTIPIEFASSDQYMSLDLVVAQQQEYLKKLADRIINLRPTVVLSSELIAGQVLDMLAQAGIAVAHKVKHSVIHRIARYTTADVVSSIEKLALIPKLGKCGEIEVKSYRFGDFAKSYIFLSGVPKELGCTIAIRGSCDVQMLNNIKAVLSFMVYVVFNLKLETNLLRDEFVFAPMVNKPKGLPLVDLPNETLTLKSPTEISPSLSAVIPSKANPAGSPSTDDDEQSETHFKVDPQATVVNAKVDDASLQMATVNDSTMINENGNEKQEPRNDLQSEVNSEREMDASKVVAFPDVVRRTDDSLPSLLEEGSKPDISALDKRILSASPSVKFKLPYMLLRVRELEDKLVSASDTSNDFLKQYGIDMKYPISESNFPAINAALQRETYLQIFNAWNFYKRQWELSYNVSMFAPSTHQNIQCLYSLVNTEFSSPCIGPDRLSIAFYSANDTTIGQFVEYICNTADDLCTEGCDRPLSVHHRWYISGDGWIKLSVSNSACPMPNMEPKILMWSHCKICGAKTPVMPMSQMTWKYSFGKYLELSLYSERLPFRAGLCSHDLHKDHKRYFSFQGKLVKVEYQPIVLLEVETPKPTVSWLTHRSIRSKISTFFSIKSRVNRFWKSVRARLDSIETDGMENAEECIEKMRQMKEEAVKEEEKVMQEMVVIFNETSVGASLPLNTILKMMHELVQKWDAAFSDLEKDYFLSENDITRITAQQLRKLILPEEDEKEEGTSNEKSEKTNQADSSEEKKAIDLVDTDIGDGDGGGGQDEFDVVQPQSTLGVDVENPAPYDKSVVEAGDEVSTAGESPGHANHKNDSLSDEGKEKAPETIAIQKGSQKSVGTNVANRINELQTSEPSTISRPPLSKEASISKLPILRSPQRSGKSTPLRPPSPTLSNFSNAGTMMDNFVHGGNAVMKVPIPSLTSSQPLSTISSGSHLSSDPRKTSFPKKISEKIASIPTYSLGKRFGTKEFGEALRKGNRVSSLAKHFEALSQEFEKERARERRRAAQRRFNEAPMPSARPVIAVYENVEEAVESEDDDDDTQVNDSKGDTVSSFDSNIDHLGSSRDTIAHTTNMDDKDVAEEDEKKGPQQSQKHDRNKHVQLDNNEESIADEGSLAPTESNESERKDATEETEQSQVQLPHTERQSLLKSLASFWASRTSSGWQALDYPIHANEYVFSDSDVIVREDEPSSVIAFCLNNPEYSKRVESKEDLEQILLNKTALHLRFYAESTSRVSCKIFYCEQFDAFRQQCQVSGHFIESLARCVKWDSSGGKSGSAFLKTLDDRLVVKQLSTTEFDAFLKFAPSYFEYMAKHLFHELPSVLAKIFGLYQVTVKSPGKPVFKMDLIVMENLFYDRKPLRIFDLKGSMRNRHVQQTGKENEVLLDENMVEYIYESPIFVRENDKRLLRSSLFNDTLFLSKMNVMDYSLVVAIDDERQQLVVGIIDFIRTFTWDKMLESWVKERSIVGGGVKGPTVISPKQYKNRFREAMERYILMVPDCWTQE